MFPKQGQQNTRSHTASKDWASKISKMVGGLKSFLHSLDPPSTSLKFQQTTRGMKKHRLYDGRLSAFIDFLGAEIGVNKPRGIEP